MGKRGPKAAETKREKNGRASRKPVDVTKRLSGHLDKKERDAVRTGVEARSRLFNIKPIDLRSPLVGSFVGRLCLTGELSPQQEAAARTYLESYHAMSKAVGGPKQSGAVNLNATRGMPGAENVTEAVKAMAEWKAALMALQERQNELRGTGALIAAMDCCVLRDVELFHMVGWLREALNALAHHYKIGDKRDPRRAA